MAHGWCWSQFFLGLGMFLLGTMWARHGEPRLEAFLQSRKRGTPLDGGSRKPSASTSTKERGTRTQATGISGATNFSSAPGALSAVSLDPTLPARVNSYTVPGVFTVETATAGVSGEPREFAGTPNDAAQRWREATARAGRKYMAELTPEERIESARRAYADGHMDIGTFERIVGEALGVSGVPQGRVV